MVVSQRDILVDFRSSLPASIDDIKVAERSLGIAIPSDYKEFLLRHDGGEGFIGSHYLILWKAADLLGHNKAYEVSIYAPGLVFFGSTGGGDGFAFDTRTTPHRVMQVPFIGMSLEGGFVVADSFDDLLQRMKMTRGALF